MYSNVPHFHFTRLSGAKVVNKFNFSCDCDAITKHRQHAAALLYRGSNNIYFLFIYSLLFRSLSLLCIELSLEFSACRYSKRPIAKFIV